MDPQASASALLYLRDMEKQKSLKTISKFLTLTVLTAGCAPVEFTNSTEPDLFTLALQDPTMQKYEESFTQAIENGQLDILVIDDNSASMAPKQIKMAQRIDSFLDKIAGIDYHIGIITTDISDGPYGRKGELLNFEGLGSYVLTPSSKNAKQVFRDTIVRTESINCRVGDCPSGDEQGLKATILAMQKKDTKNAGFFRDEARLAIVALSDEDERSDGSNNPTRGQDVLDEIKRIWGPNKRSTFFGLITEPGDTACLGAATTGARYGTVFAEFAAISGGFTGSICAEDYGTQLASIGDSVRFLLRSYSLAQVPLTGTFRIKLNPPQNIKYEIKGGNLIFKVPPEKGTKVSIEYIGKKG